MKIIISCHLHLGEKQLFLFLVGMKNMSSIVDKRGIPRAVGSGGNDKTMPDLDTLVVLWLL